VDNDLHVNLIKRFE
jgi:hypothetical protein